MTETRTLCLTDVVDSTKLAAALGDARNGALWDAHDALARALVAEWRGTELERTDGIMVLFAEPADALGFAIAYHAAVRTLDPPLLARAGIHAGPLAVRPNPPEHVARGAKRLEVDGLGIAITARVMSVAIGGQTLVTFRPDTLPPGTLPPGTTLRTVSHGHWHLKGVPEPVELFEVGDASAPFRPPPDAEKAYRVVWTDGAWLPVRAVPHHLPPQRDALVGRSADLGLLASKLDGGASVVTVFAPAGAGKSRLVLAYAWSWLGEWPGGAWWCDLSAARSLADLRSAVEAEPGTLASRGRCLVVLDGAEAVAPHLAEALAAWRDAAPDAVFVATSREPLDLPGEVALALPPLARAEAVALFVRRAEAANRDFRGADADPATLAALVEVLERWPLPVELAAARVRTTTPEALLAQLGADSRVLALVVTEVAGAAALKHALGDRAAAALLLEHQAVLRTTLAAFADGEEIDGGPERTLAAFGRPSEAVRFAATLRRALAAWSGERPHGVEDRFAVHLGEVLVSTRAGLRRADGTAARSVSGSPVDLVARLAAWAPPGRVLVTRPVFDAARQQLGGAGADGGELQWWAHGPYLLRDVVEPVEVCEVADAGVGQAQPPPDGELGRRHDPAAQVVTGWRPAVGQEVPGTRFRLARKLGEGAVGEVWLAVHAALKDQKVFKFCFQADRVRSLRREVTLFRVLRDRVGQHPNIAGVQEVSLDAPPFYLVVDFVDGPDLAHWLVPETPLAERLEVVAQVADALQAAHEAGVVHRDVKPQNILVGRDGGTVRARLADFGIGQVLSEAVLGDVTRMGFTQTMMTGPEGSISGTRLYLAPELLQGAPATPRSDLFALGIVLYQVLVGDVRRPLPVDWASQIEDPLLREDLASCFAGDPERRWVATGQLARQLRTLAERGAERERQQAAARLRERRALQRGVVGTGLGALAVVAVVAGLGWRAWQQQQRAEDLQRRAEEQEQRTAAALAENRARLYRQYVAEGRRLEDLADVTRALVYYAQALVLAEDAGDAAGVATSRVRLVATLDRIPRLLHVWPTGGTPRSVAFSADGRRLALGSFVQGAPVSTLRDLDGAELGRRVADGWTVVLPAADGGFVSLEPDGMVALGRDFEVLARGPGRADEVSPEGHPGGVGRSFPGRVDLTRTTGGGFASFDPATLAPLDLAIGVRPGERLQGVSAAGDVALARAWGYHRAFAVDGRWSTTVPWTPDTVGVLLSPAGTRLLELLPDHVVLRGSSTGAPLGAPARATGARWSSSGCAAVLRTPEGARALDPETGDLASPWLPVARGGAVDTDADCRRIVTADRATAVWRLPGPRPGRSIVIDGRPFVPVAALAEGDRWVLDDGDESQVTDRHGRPLGPAHPGSVWHVAPDACCVAMGTWGEAGWAFTSVGLADGLPLAKDLPGQPSAVLPAGHRVVVTRATGQWAVVDLVTGQELAALPPDLRERQGSYAPAREDLLAYALPGEPVTWVHVGPGELPAGLPTPVVGPAGARSTGWGITAEVLWWTCPEGLCRVGLDGGRLPPLPVPETVVAVSDDGEWVIGRDRDGGPFVASSRTGRARGLPWMASTAGPYFAPGGRVVFQTGTDLQVFDAASGERIAVRVDPAAADFVYAAHVFRTRGDGVTVPWLPAPDDRPSADWVALAELLAAVEVGPDGARSLEPEERLARFEALRQRHPEWVGPEPRDR